MLVKKQSFFGQLINIWRTYVLLTGKAQIPVAQVISQNVHHIGLDGIGRFVIYCLLGGLVGTGKRKQQEQTAIKGRTHGLFILKGGIKGKLPIISTKRKADSNWYFQSALNFVSISNLNQHGIPHATILMS
jgi:hypothetical protein